MFGLLQSNRNAIAPGKRPLSSMTPTIITKEGEVFLVLGSAGGSTIITQVLQAIVNVIDYGMNVQQAADAARFHMQWLPDKVYMEPFTFSKDTEKLLKAMGYQLQQSSPYGTDYWGGMAIIGRKDGAWQGAMDSRKPAGSAMPVGFYSATAL